MKTLLGLFWILVGVLAGNILYDNLVDKIYNWQLINILGCPCSIGLGIKLLIT